MRRVLLVVHDGHWVNVFVSQMRDHATLHSNYRGHLGNWLNVDDWLLLHWLNLNNRGHLRSRLNVYNRCRLRYDKHTSLSFCPVGEVEVVDMYRVLKLSSSYMVS